MKTKFFSLLAATMLFGLVACENSGNKNDKEDNTAVGNTGSENTETSTGDYAAKAGEFERNSEAGKYMDVRTGKPIRLSVDKSSGRIINSENSQPVTRYIYVDNNDWWVYDWEGNKLGQAKVENDKVLFDDNGSWVDYDVKWKDDENDTKVKMDEDESKIKTGDTKIKVEKDGDYKIKTGDKKIKKDEDGTKVKDNK